MADQEERETVTFSKEVARELEYGSDTRFEVVENILYGHSRWSLQYRMTIKRKLDGRYFQSTYSRGATEAQYEQPFEYSDPVFSEVFPVEKSVIVYE
jgi:hypothetical protein